MARALLFIVLVGALALVLLSLLRRAPRKAADRPHANSGGPMALPAPVVAPDRALSRSTVSQFLHELAFDTLLAAEVPAEQLKIVSAAASTLRVAATSPRYALRRPLLLPEIVRMANDSDTTRRELAKMIARDPALVGGLLKLANSPIYRRGPKAIEHLERALAVLGTQGIRSLVAAALVQPVFQTSSAGNHKFPEIVWEHTQRAAAAAEFHATAVEASDGFAAELVALVMGLGAIVVYRVAIDEYAMREIPPDPTTIASLLDAETAKVARQIAASWELSDRVLEALEQQNVNGEIPDSSLGRSLRFGLVVGGVAVLRAYDRIDDDTGLATLAAEGGVGDRVERLWGRLTWAPGAEAQS
jgi:hypothetical protein